MADQAYQLVVRKGPRPGEVFPLTLDTVTIGRDPLSDFVINDPEVSRHHAKLTRSGDNYELQDMGSTNGSFVDGKRLGGDPVELNAGQVVMLGSNVTLIYQVTSASDPLATMIAPSAMPEPEAEAPEPMEPEPLEPEPLELEPLELEPLEPEPAVEAPPIEDMTAPELPAVEVELAEPAPMEPVFEAQEPEPMEEEPDLATVLDAPAVEESLPEPEPEIEVPAPLPEFETPVPEPVGEVQEPEPLPSFEMPEPEPVMEAAEALPEFEAEPVAAEPVAEAPAQPAAADSGTPADKSRNRNMIIAVAAVLVICCCLLIVIAVVLSLTGYFDIGDVIGLAPAGLLAPALATIGLV